MLYRWSFGKTEFDEGRWQLSMEGVVVELERKPLDVLQYLLHHAGEAVTKEELLATVWEGRIVVEAVLTNAIGKLRKALRDEEQELILTLPKVGYRLDAKVSRRVVEHVPEASRLSVGDLVPRRGNWRLEQALARRGDGEVWLARHTKTGQTRVFKFSLDGFRLTGLKREVTVGRLLEQALDKRPDLVHVIDWDFEQAPYFIEFEYGGVSLDTWQEGGSGIEALPLETRLALFVEAADTVAAAHGVGVLHKDLKPANLLVYGEPGDWHLRVADFGSSRVFDPGLLDNLGITRLGLTQTQALSSDTGTPLYLAPEVMAGQVPTIKSDIYALGVTLYQLIVGDFRRPLSAGWENDIPDPLLRADIAAAANGDPTRRPESVATLAEGIRNLEQRRQKAALEASVRDRIAVAERRAALARARRPWIAAAMLVLVAGTAISLFYAQRSYRSSQQALSAQAKSLADNVRMKAAIGNADALNDFLVHKLLEPADIFSTGKSNTTLLDAWNKAEPKIATSFAGHPKPEINLRGMLARVYDANLQYDKANEQNARSVALLIANPDIPRKYEWEYRLHQGNDLSRLGKLKEAGDVIAPVLKAAAEGKLDDPNLLYSLYSLEARRNENTSPAQAIALSRKALDAAKRETAYPRAAIAAELNLASELETAGQYKEDISLLLDAQKRSTTAYGPKHTITLNVRRNLVMAYAASGKLDQAQRQLDALKVDFIDTYGKNSRWQVGMDRAQANIYALEGQYAKVLPLFASIYQHEKAITGPSGNTTLYDLREYIEVARLVDPKLASRLLDTMDEAIATLPAGAAGQYGATSALQRACVLVAEGQPGKARALAGSLNSTKLDKLDPTGEWSKRAKSLTQPEAAQKSVCATTM
ncbi:protein kinase domain-containing protein [Rhodanobacter denitrificans]|uniref:protein kinase domain-containing protein n=1 Tax=Rhodanobacter denitrificans TaxID=666685 RepID=UPI0002EA8517|nr:winged helix-turn-helix domain-containing protein [Rhodanobacter denitrificans]UJM85504.1 winged helix-turn-helix domain-containing protein [Rhodanobacter denitrificans]